MRRLIRRFDGFLRRCNGVFEFSDDPACLLRLQDGAARHDISLPDGAVRRGARVIELHLWNEHTPRLPDAGADLAYARGLLHGLTLSFRMVAEYLKRAPGFQGAKLVGGVTVLAPLGEADGGTSMLRHFGFTVFPYHSSLGRFGEFWENFYTWGLMWAFNPASLRWQSLGGLRRSEFWMLKRAFLEKFG
jgi:hypothetical protein